MTVQPARVANPAASGRVRLQQRARALRVRGARRQQEDRPPQVQLLHVRVRLGAGATRGGRPLPAQHRAYLSSGDGSKSHRPERHRHRMGPPIRGRHSTLSTATGQLHPSSVSAFIATYPNRLYLDWFIRINCIRIGLSEPIVSGSVYPDQSIRIGLSGSIVSGSIGSFLLSLSQARMDPDRFIRIVYIRISLSQSIESGSVYPDRLNPNRSIRIDCILIGLSESPVSRSVYPNRLYPD